ncbi:glutamine amidotransferase [Hansschlegelia quercus]|uniref:Glutamine amidotransferase n=1 Tax=Hansschlegelia quercus TaxID=2528245 RepID=A0A4Q9GMP3_9HYPH|nr:glutamine amidotransferase [Hansschlegelia quercus]TBN51735.1 glutamine amidotransferase [Hansschlegelia quercus]
MTKPGRRAVAIRHVAFEDLGLLARVLDAGGWETAYCEAATEDLRHRSIVDADLITMLGGPIGVGDEAGYPFLTHEKKLIERRLRRGLPTLGICLGAQLMAAALGARVYRGAGKEIGWGPISLTEDGARSALAPLGRAEAHVLHWHGHTFDLPKDATRLAFNENYENQAFSYGRDALGLQFHLEAGPLELEEWYVGHAEELARSGLSVRSLREKGRGRSETAGTAARDVFSGWLSRIAADGARQALAVV